MSTKLERLGVIVGIVSGVIAIGAFATGGFGAARSWLASRGDVELPGSYPNERWRKARADDYSWLVAQWCYPTLGDFTTEFRVSDGKLQRRNAARGDLVDTGWMDIDVYVSKSGLVRVWHHAENMPGAYFRPATDDRLSLYENDRSENDAGDIFDGKKYLALHCSRCAASADGFTYDCN